MYPLLQLRLTENMSQNEPEVKEPIVEVEPDPVPVRGT